MSLKITTFQTRPMSLHCVCVAMLLLLVNAGCSSDSMTAEPQDKTLSFPSDFLFGAAVAGFQVDMGCPTLSPEECEDSESDWHAFITSAESVNSAHAYLSGHAPSAGPGHWELYESDLELLSTDLGANAYRFSIEWSRIFPTATDNIDGYEALKKHANQDAIAHYHAMLDAMAARGITPMATINHYTLPLWIHDGVGCHIDFENCSPRGWLDKERTVREIAKYAAFVAQEFGAKIDRWATLNEPFAVFLPGYIFPSAERTNPPAVLLKFEEAKTVFAALVEAHARMYDAVKAADTQDADGNGTNSEVGVVHAMGPVRPKNPENELDQEAAQNTLYLFSLAYLNAVAKGEFDANFDGNAVFREDLAGRMDYLGINYYTRITVEGIEEAPFPELSPLANMNLFTMAPWENYPRGIYEMTMLAHKMGLPVVISENGIADPNDPEVASEFMVKNLAWLHKAIADGADVQGYFYWTLMDNYEWNHGMNMRFGLYAVDMDDPAKTRVPRKTAKTFREVTQYHGISEALQEKYPVDFEH